MKYFISAALGKVLFKGGLGGSLAWIVLLVAGSLVGAVQASERITLRVGPLAQTVDVGDLESFAETGQVPANLRRYRSILTPEVQRSLRNRLALDPAMGDRIIDEVLASPNGELLLDTLATIAPDMTVEQLQAAVQQAAAQPTGLNVLAILRSIPQETLEVDLAAGLALISQLSLSRLEGEALSSVLERSLWVNNAQLPKTELDPTLRGPQGVEIRSYEFNDRDRLRTIPLDIYFSQTQQPGPLVLMSHGFGADKRFFTYLAEHLASYGFVVVTVEHPGSNVEALRSIPSDSGSRELSNRILPASEFLDRPLDVSFVLDRLAWMNRTSISLGGRFNTDQVVLIGHSLGGYTGLALAGATLDLRGLQPFCEDLRPVGLSPADWLQCAAIELPDQRVDLSDARIVRVMAMNPLIGKLFGAQGLSQVSVPTMMLTGTRDGVTPTLEQQLRPFTQLTGPKYLLTVVGGTHLSVGDTNNVNKALTQIPFMPELRGDDTVALRRFLKAMTLSFVMQQTAEATAYEVFLDGAYTQQFSTEKLPLRFAETLPDSVLSWMRLSRQSIADAKTSWNTTMSWLHLETLEAQRRFYQLESYVSAYLKLEQISVTVLQWPLQSFLF